MQMKSKYALKTSIKHKHHKKLLAFLQSLWSSNDVRQNEANIKDEQHHQPKFCSRVSDWRENVKA